MAREKIKVTYSTLASPNPLLDQYYDESVATARQNMGATHPMYINGEWVKAKSRFPKYSPTDTSLLMGEFQEGDTEDVDRAVAVAKAAYPSWRDTPWQERIAMVRKAADLISERLFEMGAILSLEVGKNRLEALGDVEETADLMRYNCDAVEANNGFVKEGLSETERHTNRSVLKPYGVWGVISPFNFPCALSGGPVSGALVAGNTVILKPAKEAPYTNVLLADCFHSAGIPAGVFNMVTGGDDAGKALVANKDVDGITFTGSYQVGMSILRNYGVAGQYARPVVAEMGGKNATIITNKADIEKAATGVMRSAFGLQGQKCSACSRVFVHEDVKEAFTQKLVELTKTIKIGDPTIKENWMGPVINEHAFVAFQKYVADMREAGGDILAGGNVVDNSGYYVAPTIVDNLPDDHYTWTHEMFVPIVAIDSYQDKEAVIDRANDIELGLTAGFFSEDEAEVEWFLNNIEAGCVYVNRATGATTGAWPGYQSFGGWKGSSATFKAAGSHYYVQQYMREQSHTIVQD